MSLERQSLSRYHLDRAQLALSAGLLDDARRHVRVRLRHTKDCPSGKSIDTMISLRERRGGQPAQPAPKPGAYHSALDESPAVLIPRAEILIKRGLEIEAIQVLRALVSQYPDTTEAQRTLAALCLKHDRTAAAVTHLSHVLRLAPDDQTGLRLLAHTLEHIDPHAALELHTADWQARRDSATLFRMGRMLRRVGRDADAEEVYQQLLEEHPREPALWVEAGRLAAARGSHTLAVNRLEHAVSLASSLRRDAAKELACAHMRTGCYATAAWWWWRASSARRADREAWAGLTACALASNRHALAGRARSRLDQLAPPVTGTRLISSYWSHAAIGQVLMEACPELRDAEQTDRHGSLHQLLRHAAKSLADHAAAHPDRADTHYHAAMCQQELGRHETAAESVSQALHLNPGYRDANRLAKQFEHTPRGLAA